MTAYGLLLRTPSGDLIELDSQVPRVTAILKDVFGAVFGPASYWGFKLGIKSQSPDAGMDEIEKLYANAKQGPHAPSKVRDDAGDRGTAAHAMLEAMAKGLEAPEPKSGYEQGVVRWWKDNMHGWKVVASERSLWSRHGFAGTPDLLRVHGGGTHEVVDLKTHKPALEFGPAYFEELVQLAAYDGMWSEQEWGDYGAARAEHRVVLVNDEGGYVEDCRYIGPEVFLKVHAIYRTMMEVRGNG